MTKGQGFLNTSLCLILLARHALNISVTLPKETVGRVRAVLIKVLTNDDKEDDDKEGDDKQDDDKQENDFEDDDVHQ